MALNQVDLMKKHFPFFDVTAGELYSNHNEYPDTSWFFYKNTRFSYIFEENKGKIDHCFDLYRSDGEYAVHRIGKYEMITIYDVSNIDKVRAFLLEYIHQQDNEDLMWSLKDAVDYF